MGKIIGKRDGMCKIDIFNRIPNSIFLLEPLLMSSIKSIEIKRMHANIKITIYDGYFYNQLVIKNLRI